MVSEGNAMFISIVFLSFHFAKLTFFHCINHQYCKNQTRTKPVYIKLQHKIKGIIT